LIYRSLLQALSGMVDVQRDGRFRGLTDNRAYPAQLSWLS